MGDKRHFRWLKFGERVVALLDKIRALFDI